VAVAQSDQEPNRAPPAHTLKLCERCPRDSSSSPALARIALSAAPEAFLCHICPARVFIFCSLVLDAHARMAEPARPPRIDETAFCAFAVARSSMRAEIATKRQVRSARPRGPAARRISVSIAFALSATSFAHSSKARCMFPPAQRREARSSHNLSRFESSVLWRQLRIAT